MWCIYLSCLSAFPCVWLVCPSYRVNKSYVNVNVKGSISAADRKRNNQGFFYSSIINEDWRLIYRLITRQHREWCRDTRMDGVNKKERADFLRKWNRGSERESRRGGTGIGDLIDYEINQHVFVHKYGFVNTSVIIPVTINLKSEIIPLVHCLCPILQLKRKRKRSRFMQ